MRILCVVGARPNFMKIAPVMQAFRERYPTFTLLLVHTGQHYDANMSEVFFRELGMPRPDVNLDVGSGTHAQQTALVMSRIEPVLVNFRPDIVLVAGDVNSTLAAALVAKKLNIRVGHVEAGLRSFDMNMPEEINRICTDTISDLLFTTDAIADANLAREGVSPEKIHFVGNVMIDSLLTHRLVAAGRRHYERLGLESGKYGVLTMHRPSNVDEPNTLRGIWNAVREVARDLPVVFPVHPRTRRRLEELHLVLEPSSCGIRLLEPLGYLDFLSITMAARVVLTDSGGLQEETTILGIPCVTLRENTERPITITQGTNRLAGKEYESVLAATASALEAGAVQPRVPQKWDGQAARRIVEIIALGVATDVADASTVG